MKALYILDEYPYNVIYGPDERADIDTTVEVYAPQQTRDSVRSNPAILRDVEVILSGWGGPKMDEEFLASAPNLKAVFYGAGSIKGIVTDAFWDRGIVITSAYGANAVPVAEYALSQILFCLKHGWQFALGIKRNGAFPSPRPGVPGAYRTTVGIISLGMIGRKVCELLRAFDVQVIAYDPFASEETARSLGAELCSLEELFRRSDVVSLHTPLLQETRGMITGEHFASMKEGASFINTSRGAVVREPEMIEVLQRRTDLFAVLDVTSPEPPEPGSPLYTMDNVILTPHIAGSMDLECRRMGRYMAEELGRYLRGEPLCWGIDREKAAVLA